MPAKVGAPAAAVHGAGGKFYLVHARPQRAGRGPSPGWCSSVGLVLQYMISAPPAETHLPSAAAALDRLGPAAGVLARAWARWILGYPFTSHGPRSLPLIGEIHVASAMFFDMRSLVVGATLLILAAIAHQSVAQPPPSRPPAGVSSSLP